MLKLENLSVSVEGKQIVKNVNAEFDGLNILMGPNGSGKSSLAFAIAGHPKYKTKGRIFLDGKEISSLKPEERAKLGLFMAFQNPPEIEGLSMKRFAGMLSDAYEEEARSSGIENLLERSLNYKFSGGEKKRCELFQLLLLKPKFAILDEIDSGLDVEGIRKVLETIEKMKNTSFLFITHHPETAELIKANRVCVMLDGKSVYAGGKEIIKRIKEEGYAWAV
ncbi:MAG: ABC transporter ATP-binding protein [Candidatus Anstonellales archaeon]